jgi:hypothetical protein
MVFRTRDLHQRQLKPPTTREEDAGYCMGYKKCVHFSLDFSTEDSTWKI